MGFEAPGQLAVQASGVGPAIDSDSYYEHEFVATGKYLFSEDDISSWDESNIWVLSSLVYLPSKRVASHADPISLRDFLDALPRDEVGESRPRQQGDGTAKSKLMMANPWMMSYIDEGRNILRKHSGARASVVPPLEESLDNDRDEDPIEHVVDVEEVADALTRAREEAAPDTTDCFRVVPLGGRWTAQHLGVAQDAWRAQCAIREAKAFCAAVGLQDSARFDTNLYTHQGALLMARYWVLKMQFFFDNWVGRDCPSGGSPPDGLRARFAEPAEFVTFASSALPPKAKARVAWLRDMKPRVG